MVEKNEALSQQGLTDAMVEDMLFGTYQSGIWHVSQEHGQLKMLAEIRNMMSSGDPRLSRITEDISDIKKIASPSKTAHEMALLAQDITRSHQYGVDRVTATTEGVRQAIERSEGTSRQVGSAITGRIIAPSGDMRTLLTQNQGNMIDLFIMGALAHMDEEVAEDLYIASLAQGGASMSPVLEQTYRKNFHATFDSRRKSENSSYAADGVENAIRLGRLDRGFLETIRKSGYMSSEVELELINRGVLESFGLDGIHRAIRAGNQMQMASLAIQQKDVGLSHDRNQLLTNIQGILGSELGEANEWLEGIYDEASQSSELLEYMNGTLGEMLDEQIKTNGYMVAFHEGQKIQISQGQQVIALNMSQQQLLEQIIELHIRQLREQQLQQEELKNALQRSLEGIVLFLGQAFSGMQRFITSQFTDMGARLQGIQTEIQKQGEESERIKCRQYCETGHTWLIKKKYDRAKKDFGKSLDFYSIDFTGNIGLALSEIGLGNEEQAEKQCEVALDVATNEAEHVYAVKCWARLKQTQGDRESALRITEENLTKLPDDKELQFLYAECLLVNNKKEEALTVLHQLISDDHTYLFRLRENEACRQSISMYTDIFIPLLQHKKGDAPLFTLLASELYLLGDDMRMRESMEEAMSRNIHTVLHTDDTTKALFLAQKEGMQIVMEELLHEKKERFSSQNVYSLVLLYHFIYPEQERQALQYLMEGWAKDEQVQTYMERKEDRKAFNYISELFPEGPVLLKLLTKCGNVPLGFRAMIHTILSRES